tara:strand:- start:11716 stop:12177 length:462 start_codon:yes stop_codon:yes gene_type:complete
MLGLYVMIDKLMSTVNSKTKLLEFCEELVDFWVEHKYITVSASAKRSNGQNRAIRECYKQILDQNEGFTAKYVERLCKLQHGVPILISSGDEIKQYVFENALSGLNHEQELKAMDSLAVTSTFSPAQAHMFIEQIMDDYPYITLSKTKKNKFF